MSGRRLYPLVWGGVAFCGILSSAATGRAQIQVAGELFVELDAGHDTAGDPEWTNTGSLGNFFEVGDPVLTSHEGAPAVSFNGAVTNDAYQMQDPAPDGLVGLDPTRSIEVWVFNPEIASEETLVAWGRRGGPDGTNMSFNYGTDVNFGAVGHWGLAGPDLGWGAVPAAAQWHHLAYTYDGTTTRVYADGVETNSEDLGAGAINTHAGTGITLAAQIFDDGVSLDFGGGRQGSLSIGRVRVHDEVLTPEQVLNNYTVERDDFPVPGVPPVFVNAPVDEDFLYKGSPLYGRALRVTGTPPPELELLEPAGATLSADGRLSYVIPGPESFTVAVRATNDAAVVDASWEVMLIDPPVRADIEIAEELLVELDARDLTAGSPFWLNSGTLADFGEVGDPVLTVIDGVDAVSFNDGVTDDAYQSFEDAPDRLVGLDPTRSIEVWVYNLVIDAEETLVAWGRRGGPDGTNMSFNYGSDVNFGAVGHWGTFGPDLGWGAAPAAAQWHHLAYTYDGATTRVYADGFESNIEDLGAGAINTHALTQITLAAQILDDGLTLDFGPREGVLALARVRVHGGALTPEQVLDNFLEERGDFPVPDEPPVFLDAPLEDLVVSGGGSYTRALRVRGLPVPTLEVLDPPGATISEAGLLTYDLPDPEPESFLVAVRAENSAGEAQVSWTVTVLRPEVLSAAPAHRYSFDIDAADSIGGAHGTVYGDVFFELGQAVLNNDGTQSSAGSGIFPDELDPGKLPPGAYIDLPNGIISALGEQATFEAWVTWDGPIGSVWQRVFDFGTSDGGENDSGGGTFAYYLFLTPQSGENTLRFGYRNGGFPAIERHINHPRLLEGSEQHLAVVWDGLTTTAELYLNGLLVDRDTETHFSLLDVPDVNNWLGRSQWPDAMFDGSYNEFRIYNYALNERQVLGNFQAGPDTVNLDGGPQEMFVRGDADSSDRINLTDGVLILNWLFLGGPEPACLDASDTDDNGSINLTDAVRIFNWLFTGGPPPLAPSPTAADYLTADCGTDDTPDADEGDLGCAELAEKCN